MTSLIVAAVLVLAAIGLGVFYLIVVGRPNPPLRSGEMKVGSVTFTVEIATSTVEQARGLSFRTGLDAGHGMLFIFRRGGIQNFWMKDMNFPLDIIWIAKDRVAGFAENAPAEPGVAMPSNIYSSPDGVDKVLEVNAGTVKAENIKEGDAVVLPDLR